MWRRETATNYLLRLCKTKTARRTRIAAWKVAASTDAHKDGSGGGTKKNLLGPAGAKTGRWWASPGATGKTGILKSGDERFEMTVKTEKIEMCAVAESKVPRAQNYGTKCKIWEHGNPEVLREERGGGDGRYYRVFQRRMGTC